MEKVTCTDCKRDMRMNRCEAHPSSLIVCYFCHLNESFPTGHIIDNVVLP